MKNVDSKILFLLCLLIAGSGFLTPPLALVGGVAFAFLVAEHPMRAESARLSKVLLQASVVLLGFGMDVQQVVRAGRAGFAYTAIGLSCALVLGTVLGKLLRVSGRASFLITVGTAICGGSAIAAVAPVLEAGEEEISVAMGTVFLLNSIALIAFPLVGHAFALGQTQFGLWAALAIHDTSSVVGAGAAYGAQALQVGTTVKLARALWIVPVSLATAAVTARQRKGARAKVAVPWFIGLFCLAALVHAMLPTWSGAFSVLTSVGKTGLTATLFLIGSGLSRATLQKVGIRPLVQGVLLWLMVAVVSLAAIRDGLIAL